MLEPNSCEQQVMAPLFVEVTPSSFKFKSGSAGNLIFTV